MRFGCSQFAFQFVSAFSTQSIFDSMYLTLFNLVFTSAPCLLLAVTDRCWPQERLLELVLH